MDDRVFAEIGLSPPDVTGLRERLAAWPRGAEAADREYRSGDPSEHHAAAGQAPTAGRTEPDMREPDLAVGQQLGSEPAAQAGRDDPEAEP